MRQVVRWTSKEQMDVARACLKFFQSLPEFHDLSKLQKADILNYRGFFKEVFPSAQNQVIPENRHRQVVSHTMVPWLAPAMMQLAADWLEEESHEPQVKLTDAEVLANALCDKLADRVSDLVVQKLAERFNLQPKAVHEKARPALVEPTPVKPRQLSLAIMGLVGPQVQDVVQAWGSRVQLKFVSAHGGPKGDYDYVIVMTEKVSEHTKANLRKALGHQYKPAHGATSSVKKIINDLYAQYVNSMRPS